MSLDLNEQKIIEKVIDEIGKKISKNEKDLKEKAIDDFDQLWNNPNGNVEGIFHGKDSNIVETTEKEVLQENIKNDEKYGVDASVTQVISLDNNIRICIANSKIGTSTKNLDYEDESIMYFVVYDPFNSIEEDINQKYDEDEYTTAYTKLITGEDIPIAKINDGDLKNLARTMAEGETIKKLTERVENCTIYIDGCILPQTLVNRFIFFDKETNQGFDHITGQILKNYYIRSIEKAYNKNITLLGVAKTSYAKDMVKSIGKEEEWTRDMVLMYNALKTEDNNQVAYTRWVEEEARRMADQPDKRILEEIEDELEFNIDAYNRCWFYYYEPNSGNLKRVEAPAKEIRGLKQEVAKEAVQDMTKQEDSPEVIKRADELATITNDQQNNIRRMLGSRLVKDYNIDERSEHYNK